MADAIPNTLAHSIAQEIREAAVKAEAARKSWNLDDAWTLIDRNDDVYAMGGDPVDEPFVHGGVAVYTGDMTIMFEDGSLLTCDDDGGRETRVYANVAEAVLAGEEGVVVGEQVKVEEVEVTLKLSLAKLAPEQRAQNPRHWNWQNLLIKNGYDVDVLSVSATTPQQERGLDI